MDKKAMFDFALEQKNEWKKTNDETYRVAFLTALHMIELSGLWDDWKKYHNEICK